MTRYFTRDRCLMIADALAILSPETTEARETRDQLERIMRDYADAGGVFLDIMARAQESRKCLERVGEELITARKESEGDMYRRLCEASLEVARAFVTDTPTARRKAIALATEAIAMARAEADRD